MGDVKDIYSLRKSFSIIGLTGRASAGCSVIAEKLSLSEKGFIELDAKEYRAINELKEHKKKFQTSLFKRKYSIVYKYALKNWIEYKVIDYKKVLFFYLINSVKTKEDPIKELQSIINANFCKSKEGYDDEIDEDFNLEEEEIKRILAKHSFLDVVYQLNQIKGDILKVRKQDDLNALYHVFFKEGKVQLIFNDILALMQKTNYYIAIFFFHRIGNKIRQYGSIEKGKEVNPGNVYTVVNLINRLIKAYKFQEEYHENCHIVIDSFKNSLEIMFFKERYSAFYMLSVHNDDNYKIRIEDKIKHEDHFDWTKSKIIDLDDIEHNTSSFSDGDFFAPDVQNCIQKSEVHIEFNKEINHKELEFYTIIEQLMKLNALIQQPGIITPTNVERCMQIAFNSKFNSGCISRQVGAVITDEGFSVKSVGWNDTPKNTIACLFRSVKEIENKESNIAYSKFERMDHDFLYSENEITAHTKEDKEITVITNKEFVGNNFAKNLLDQLSDKVEKVEAEGKNCSFCFKSNHNKFEGEKNQVHTRSLHAEENAMLQISKHGGQKLTKGNLFTTASPCELCSKKAFQLGISKVYFIDKYPGISKEHVLNNGFNAPKLIPFKGIIGSAFNKLYDPFMSYKDELSLYKKKSTDN
jgi:dCMP deaminase